MKKDTLPRQDKLRGPLMGGCSLWVSILPAASEPKIVGGQDSMARVDTSGDPQDIGADCVAEKISG